MVVVRFALLGPLEVQAAGVVVPVGGPRQRAVLARLLVEPRRVVTTDALVDAVWGEHPPATAVKTLQKYVVELRRALGPAAVRTRGHGYVLDVPDDQVDARTFERLVSDARSAAGRGDVATALACLTEAEGLWRGEVLADFPDASFAAPERARLQLLRLSAVENAVELELALGRHEEVAARAAELVEQHPVSERLWSALVLSLYRSGRQVDALQAYDRCRRLLDDEYGVEPSAALRRLEVAILRQDPDLQPPAAALPGPGNLPPPRTRLVGRLDELAALRAALDDPLDDHRLVTVTGTAGVGKTRLALAAAAAARNRFPGGCWFVDLAAVAVPELVTRAVADTLRVDAQPGEELLDTLVAALSYRPPTLLVLDNCEHLLHAAAHVAERLLDGAAPIDVLATSRQRLGVPGEQVRALAPLPVDDPAGGRSDAVELFVRRAAESAPDIVLSGDDLVAVTRICRQLDGLPLAIELAASQLRVLEPSEIVVLLDDQLRFVASGGGDPSSRHRSLEAAVDWSFQRLTPAAQALFDRLAVFADTATLEAVEAVAPAGTPRAEVIAALVDLVDGSLLARERGPASLARYRMLRTLRLYGLNRLEASGGLDEARRAHASYFLGLANAAGPRLYGSEELTWKRRLRAEEPNLRAALTWATRHDQALAAAMCVALQPYWSSSWRGEDGLGVLRPLLERKTGRRFPPSLVAATLTAAASLSSAMGEARQASAWAEEALTWYGDSGDPERSHAQLALGAALGTGGEFSRSEALLDEVISSARARDDRVLLGLALEAAGLVASRRGDHAEARRLHLLELDVWTELGSLGWQSTSLLLLSHAARSLGYLAAARDLAGRAMEGYQRSENPVAAAHVLNVLGDVARLQGDLDGAESTYQQALSVFRACGDRGCLASTDKNLATISAERGDLDQALVLFRESLLLRDRLGDTNGVTECLQGIAGIALERNEPVSAATLLGASTALRTATPASAPDRGATPEQLVARAHTALDSVTFDQAWAAGAGMNVRDAVDHVAGLWPAAPAAVSPRLHGTSGVAEQ